MIYFEIIHSQQSITMAQQIKTLSLAAEKLIVQV